jgi:hypothetical protein
MKDGLREGLYRYGSGGSQQLTKFFIKDFEVDMEGMPAWDTHEV